MRFETKTKISSENKNILVRQFFLRRFFLVKSVIDRSLKIQQESLIFGLFYTFTIFLNGTGVCLQTETSGCLIWGFFNTSHPHRPPWHTSVHMCTDLDFKVLEGFFLSLAGNFFLKIFMCLFISGKYIVPLKVALMFFVGFVKFFFKYEKRKYPEALHVLKSSYLFLYWNTPIYIYIYTYMSVCVWERVCVCVCVCNTHTHTHIYIYIFVCVCNIYIYIWKNSKISKHLSIFFSKPKISSLIQVFHVGWLVGWLVGWFYSCQPLLGYFCWDQLTNDDPQFYMLQKSVFKFL